MKVRLLLVGLGVSLLLIAAQKKEKGRAGSGWKTFTSKEGAFEVLMPGVPTEEKKTLQLGSGPTELNLFVVERKKEEAAYIVAYCEFPASALQGASPEERLNYARNRAVSRTRGKLAGEKKIKLGSFPGRELRFETEGKGLVRQRLFAVKDKLYQVMVAGPKETVLSREADKFLESFKLLPASK
jgi:hypothetical protein